MTEHKNTTAATEDIQTVHEEFKKEFLPSVHRIGIGTMAAALVMTLAPTIYFVFIRGIDVSWKSFLAVVTAIFSFSITMWITEPMAFWPVLGSAGTYLAFLAGNASNMRLPVALNARATVDEEDDLEHPKVHCAMIIALFASVVVNLAILLVIVIAGDLLLNLLPASILAAFGFIMPCLMANNIIMRSKGKDGSILPGLIDNLPFFAAGFIGQYLCRNVFTGLKSYGMLVAVFGAIGVAYLFYLKDCAADKRAENQ
ncbi:MAG: hypothetical protein KH009_08060 [Clostridiales bacterium]|nr:hypothetical protein [Clostridiales bacterium]